MLRRTANPHLEKQWLIMDPRTGQPVGFTGSRSDVTIEKLRSTRQGRPHVIYELTAIDRYQPPTAATQTADEVDEEEEDTAVQIAAEVEEKED